MTDPAEVGVKIIVRNIRQPLQPQSALMSLSYCYHSLSILDQYEPIGLEGHKVSYRPHVCPTYHHQPLNAVCAGCGVHSKSVSALVTRALATIINLGKLAALVKVSGDKLPAVYNGSYTPRERALTITCDAKCVLRHQLIQKGRDCMEQRQEDFGFWPVDRNKLISLTARLGLAIHGCLASQ